MKKYKFTTSRVEFYGFGFIICEDFIGFVIYNRGIGIKIIFKPDDLEYGNKN